MEFKGVCLITKNVPALKEFYMRILGAEAVGDDTHVDLMMQGSGMSIFSVNGMEEMAPGSMKGAGYGSFTLSFKVDDVDAEYERLKTMGVEFVKLPQTHPWGWRSVWFRDPDGNIVNFACPVEG